MRVELLGGGVSTDFGHSRGPSLNLRNQHVSGKTSPAPWPFARRSRGSPHGSAMYPDHSFNASAVLTDAPLHDRGQGGAQSPSRLHAYRSPPCLTLRLLTAKHTRRRVDIPPTPALQLLTYFPAVLQQDERSDPGTPSPPLWAEAAQGSQGRHYPRRSLLVETGRQTCTAQSPIIRAKRYLFRRPWGLADRERHMSHARSI